MKTTKLSKTYAILCVLFAVVFTGCKPTTQSSTEEPDLSVSYKVEIGDISLDDYTKNYSDWIINTADRNFDAYKAQRDVLKEKTIEGTYENKGTIKASELKKYLIENNQKEPIANSAINGADWLDNNLVAFIDESVTKATWVYIEKAK